MSNFPQKTHHTTILNILASLSPEITNHNAFVSQGSSLRSLPRKKIWQI